MRISLADIEREGANVNVDMPYEMQLLCLKHYISVS
jgi:hypothetical protein